MTIESSGHKSDKGAFESSSEFSSQSHFSQSVSRLISDPAVPTPNPDKKLLISVHDVTPLYAKELEFIFTELHKRSLNRFMALVEPAREGKYPLSRNALFVARIKKLEREGAQLVLHGYRHARCECKVKDTATAHEMIDAGMSEFKKAFGSNPRLYVPPNWQMSDAFMYELKHCGFKYTETLTHMIWMELPDTIIKQYNIPLGMESLFSHFELLTAAITQAWTILATNYMKNRTGVIRFSFHPREVNTGKIHSAFKQLDKLLKAGWTPVLVEGKELK